MTDDRLDFQPGEPLRGTPYRVLKRVGAGGMGAVFEIEHVRLKKRLIAKTMHPGMRARQDFVTRMELEAQTLARIAHPNIVQVHDLGVTEDGIPFFVMEKLEGSDLRKLLRSRRYLDIQDAITIVEDVLEALAHAHREGVIHRDIKPENIFLARSGAETVTKILDFGIAKVMDDTRNLTGARFLGTCQYAAPEQLRGERASERTDIYAVGCLLFELVSGRRPFQGPTTNDFIRQHLGETAPRLASVSAGVPPALDAIVASALEKDPEKRPSSALWFASQLHQIQQVTQHVELAQANTTEEMLLTAITEGVSSSSPELPFGGKTADDTVRDGAVGEVGAAGAPGRAAQAETMPEPRAKTVEAFDRAARDGARAPTPRMSSEEHLRRAATRTSPEALPRPRRAAHDTEQLPLAGGEDAEAPSATPSPHVLALEEGVRTDGTMSSSRVAPSSIPRAAASSTMSARRRSAIIASPVVVGVIAAIAILVFGRPRPGASTGVDGTVSSAAPRAETSLPAASAASLPVVSAPSSATPATPATATSATSATSASPAREAPSAAAGRPATPARGVRATGGSEHRDRGAASAVAVPLAPSAGLASPPHAIAASATPSQPPPPKRDDHLLRTF